MRKAPISIIRMLTNTTNEADRDDEPTRSISHRSMTEMVYGHRPRLPRFRGVVALAVALLAGAAGCHATVAPVEVETVGQLSASYGSVRSAPVHATTDLSPGFQAVDTDEGPAVGGAGEQVEAPAVTAKSGLSMGTVR
jgi:hypothetical protein